MVRQNDAERTFKDDVVRLSKMANARSSKDGSSKALLRWCYKVLQKGITKASRIASLSKLERHCS